MGIGPGLVIRGLIIGVVAVILLTGAMSTSATYSQNVGSISADEIIQDNQNTNNENKSDSVPEKYEFGCEVSTKFPEKVTRWCDLITQYAQKNGLEPDLIAALIWQESGGDPRAYSKSGAVGLMQVMPRDGVAASFTCANGPCFGNRPKINELEDPEFNIKFGTRMLAQLVNRNGNIRAGLKAYGPMDVGFYYADKVLSIYQRYGD